MQNSLESFSPMTSESHGIALWWWWECLKNSLAKNTPENCQNCKKNRKMEKNWLWGRHRAEWWRHHFWNQILYLLLEPHLHAKNHCSSASGFSDRLGGGKEANTSPSPPCKIGCSNSPYKVGLNCQNWKKRGRILSFCCDVSTIIYFATFDVDPKAVIFSEYRHLYLTCQSWKKRVLRLLFAVT